MAETMLRIFLIVSLFSILFPHLVFANTVGKDQKIEILTKNIEELLNMEITSVSKRPQKLHTSASAIYVVTQEDIRRVGAVNIMEALRIVPGVLVSKINQNRYAVSIRGFNRRVGSDKLLVLMDGRTLYSPSAAGVFWMGQDTVMEDIDRIEVIRGPGAALWGSNAVAGVINIITKDSKKTNGLMISGGAGSEERGFATVRFGDRPAPNFNYRVYGKYRIRDEGESTSSADAIDDKEMEQGGFRADWEPTSKDMLTFQGDTYNVKAGVDFTSRFVSLAAGSAPFRGDQVQQGNNLLARWTRQLEEESSFQIQAYYDRLQRYSILPFNHNIHQFDLEAQHNFTLGKVHQISWGLNYRNSFFDFEKTNIVTLPNESTNLFGAFIHDEISLIPDTLSLIVGAKLEHNPFSGLEFQPNVRAVWFPKEGHTLWAAFSRAVRLPTINEEKSKVNRVLIPAGPPPPTPILLTEDNLGNLDAEKLLAYEAGYRWSPDPKVSLDLTAYVFQYSDVIELTQMTPFFDGTNTVVPFTHRNGLDGEAYGAELAVHYQPLETWRLSASDAYNDVDLRATIPNVVVPSPTSEGDLDAEGEPNHILSLRSYVTLPHGLQWDTMFYYVDQNKARNIEDYNRLDVRLGWQVSEKIELSVIGQNLLDASHAELREIQEVDTRTQRSFYVKTTLKF
ncbi:MAG: TonB-dependent receptor [Nitrospinota bacterium]|nr:TonB-dependent receptor [Nitrospinota bacterium]